MYSTDTSVPGSDIEQASSTEGKFSMPPWWYCIRGWLLVQVVYRSSIHAQVRFFARNISSSHLDIPTGEGTLLSLVLLWRKLILRRAPAKITGVDYSQNMVDAAIHRLAARPDIQIQWGDVGDLPFADGSFSSVNIPNGFHCFPDPDRALQELRRLLRPGGSLAANILLHPQGPRFMRRLPRKINAHYIRRGDLNRTFGLKQVLKMVRRHGFTIEQDRVSGNTLYLVATRWD